MRTVSTVVQGAPCKVTEPLNPPADSMIYVIANDDTITRTKNDGRAWFLVVACECQAQADHVIAQMQERPELGSPMVSRVPMVENRQSAPHVIPFRLLGRRWLAEWRETQDRIEVRESGAGALTITVIIDEQQVRDKYVSVRRLDEAPSEIANFRGLYPSLYLFDYRA